MSHPQRDLAGRGTALPTDPDAFTIHRATVRDGVELAYIREGIGGVPPATFQAGPFVDPAHLRASLSFYVSSAHLELLSEPPLLASANNHTETMILCGMEDMVLNDPRMCQRARIGYRHLVGPFMVPDAGPSSPGSSRRCSTRR